MQKMGATGDGKSAVTTPDGKSRKKNIIIDACCIISRVPFQLRCLPRPQSALWSCCLRSCGRQFDGKSSS